MPNSMAFLFRSIQGEAADDRRASFDSQGRTEPMGDRDVDEAPACGLSGGLPMFNEGRRVAGKERDVENVGGLRKAPAAPLQIGLLATPAAVEGGKLLLLRQ
jgi:hypothetical protein